MSQKNWESKNCPRQNALTIETWSLTAASIAAQESTFTSWSAARKLGPSWATLTWSAKKNKLLMTPSSELSILRPWVHKILSTLESTVPSLFCRPSSILTRKILDWWHWTRSTWLPKSSGMRSHSATPSLASTKINNQNSTLLLQSVLGTFKSPSGR